jgi:hypothetical protein
MAAYCRYMAVVSGGKGNKEINDVRRRKTAESRYGWGTQGKGHIGRLREQEKRQHGKTVNKPDPKSHPPQRVGPRAQPPNTYRDTC